MRLPRKLILLCTLWAYAVQAVAGVAVTGCQHEGESGHVVAATAAGMAHQQADHLHMNHPHADHAQLDHTRMQHAPAPAADQDTDAVGPDCCAHCSDGNCSCGSHGCASAQGVLPAAAALVANNGADVPVARALDSRLLPAHSLGLIRPPGRS